MNNLYSIVVLVIILTDDSSGTKIKFPIPLGDPTRWDYPRPGVIYPGTKKVIGGYDYGLPGYGYDPSFAPRGGYYRFGVVFGR